MKPAKELETSHLINEYVRKGELLHSPKKKFEKAKRQEHQERDDKRLSGVNVTAHQPTVIISWLCI